MKSTAKGRRWSCRVSGALLVVVALTLPSSAGAACLKAMISADLVLPDGSTHAAETVGLCRIKALSPVADLLETRINGVAVGMFIGRKQVIESPASIEETALVFYRTGSAELELYGCLEKNDGAPRAYELETIGKTKKPRVVTRELFSENSRAPSSPLMVLPAAVTR